MGGGEGEVKGRGIIKHEKYDRTYRKNGSVGECSLVNCAATAPRATPRHR